jgi:hypothetical protein
MTREKIKMFEDERGKMQELKNKISRTEHEIELLKNPDINSDISIVAHAGEGNGAIIDIDDKTRDDIRCLMIYNKTKRLGELKKKYDNFSPNLMTQMLLLSDNSIGCSNK